MSTPILDPSLLADNSPLVSGELRGQFQASQNNFDDIRGRLIALTPLVALTVSNPASLTCAAAGGRYFIPMAITNLAVAEEALSLAPAERADLAKLLVQSLEGDSRTDEAIKADLTRRLEDLVSGKDAGLNFNQVFGNAV
ncbi:MAG: addiction module protein [Verrucomicrobiota bacterium]|jgi:putative addiction module component (TIGR02574 family)